MTGGALIQLVSATGEQDLYLTGHPEISFFNNVHVRHTNFAMETIEEPLISAAGFGQKCRCPIPRLGDLIHNMTLRIDLGSLNPEFYKKVEQNRLLEHVENGYTINEAGQYIRKVCECSSCLERQFRNNLQYGYVNSLGHALIESVAIEIAGQEIDKQYGEWMHIWAELTTPAEKFFGYRNLIKQVDVSTFTATTFSGPQELYIPLYFWFTRNPGAALPIMALTYHRVELVIDFRKFNQLWVSNNPTAPAPPIPSFDAAILTEYIYLDIEERRKFYLSSHFYLIEQLQCSGTYPAIGSSCKIDLHFNHPVKELVWVLQRNDATLKPSGIHPSSNYPKGNDLFNYTTATDRSLDTTEESFKVGYLTLNGTYRFRQQRASYFRKYQTYYRHTRVPANNIYVYSFGLDPEDTQPSGHLNFSRVDNAVLHLEFESRRNYSSYNVRVYGLGWNYLMITSGMASLVFYS